MTKTADKKTEAPATPEPQIPPPVLIGAVSVGGSSASIFSYGTGQTTVPLIQFSGIQDLMHLETVVVLRELCDRVINATAQVRSITPPAKATKPRKATRKR